MNRPNHKALYTYCSTILSQAQGNLDRYLSDLTEQPHRELQWIDKVYDASAEVQVCRDIIMTIGPVDGAGMDEDGLLRQDIWDSILSRFTNKVGTITDQGNAGSRLMHTAITRSMSALIQETRYML